MVITTLYLIRQESHREPLTEVGSKSPAKCTQWDSSRELSDPELTLSIFTRHSLISAPHKSFVFLEIQYSIFFPAELVNYCVFTFCIILKGLKNKIHRNEDARFNGRDFGLV